MRILYIYIKLKLELIITKSIGVVTLVFPPLKKLSTQISMKYSTRCCSINLACN